MSFIGRCSLDVSSLLQPRARLLRESGLEGHYRRGRSEEDEQRLANLAELISADATCYDAVYAPPMTPFLREGERAGAEVAGGLSMLIYQGAVGFELVTGKSAPVEQMFAALAASG